MEYAFTIKYEIKMAQNGYLTQYWRNVTADVIGTSKCKAGISGSGPLDRVASTGTLSFTLHNENNKYTPGNESRIYDLTSGCAVRLSFEYQGRNVVTKFYGFIPPSGINIDLRPQFNTIGIEAVDFVEHLANHELDLPAYTTSKRMDEIAPLIMANLTIQPLSTSYGTGQDTFANVFDTVKSTTRALSELGKLSLSEMGYVYVRATSTSDEVLITEGRNRRNGKEYSTVFEWNGVISALLLESGDHILQENNGQILIENVYTATYPLFDESMGLFKVNHAKNYFNSVKTTVYPRRTGAANEVLYNLEYAVAIAAGTTVYITGRFMDPDQEAQNVAGISMTNPVATTDYLMNSAADGSGTNMTASLTVGATYGVNGVDYTLTNTHGTDTGYVTFLQARGTGIYTYRQADYVESDSTLVSAEGKHMLTIDMRYQNNPLVGEDIAVYLLAQHKEKITTIDTFTFITNKTRFLINAFLDVGIGDKVQINETGSDIYRAFFVNYVEFSVQPGGLVVCTWGLKDSLYETYTDDMWILGTSVLDTSTILGI